MNPETAKYVRSIRNAAKKTFAQRYWLWMQSGEQGDPPSWGDLSVMAAQAVWMTLRELNPDPK